ncbi:PREDICTED: uncharacterized protein LOC109359907 [Lupinus angustifolius]|uniref:uncharacterized protein LOC109359907 n=1 Tax=Lupinus angustifolius TaxID=3871 RepID=UPI00092EAB74|nr:PREDICTED: uncharacterized protein LOC109359907 [Lupinus angustifolius]
MEVSITNRKNTDASIRNLETHVGKLAKQMAKQHLDRQQFSENTQTNPEEHCKAITTRSGKVIEGEKSGHSEKKKGELPQLKNIPYPKNPSKNNKDIQYTRFMDIFKNLHINIPFMEDMEQMSTYVKFMKDFLIRKRKFTEETVTLEAGCSAIIQKSLPEKTKDLGSFTIPVTIGELSVGKALLDLGAIINLMPLSMLKRIGDLEIKPIRMTLQVVDRSMKFPYGVVEDVLVKVDQLVFPLDFVIMDIEEDAEVPLILGRPFTKIVRVIIDVDDGKLKVKVQDEEVNFNVFEAMNHPKDKQRCFRADVIDELYMIDAHLHNNSPLEKVLMGESEGRNVEEEKCIDKCVAELDAFQEVSYQQT